MLLLVGLGNPGPDYASNRHNVGFMAVDAIIHRHGFGPFRSKFQGLISEGLIGGKKILALKPLTFMNESGRSLGEAARFYKIAPENIIVCHDELDLAPGKVRVKKGGGTGGHNGIKSIDAHMGPDYQRIRIGIGHPGNRDKVTPHVLSDFAKIDKDWLVDVLEAIAANLDLLVEGQNDAFMTEVAQQTNPPSPANVDNRNTNNTPEKE